MRTIKLSKKIYAPRQVLGDILADFGNVADWNTGVNESRYTSVSKRGRSETPLCSRSRRRIRGSDS
jgi:hypothetical protein